MKLNDYGSPKAVPSLDEQIAQESDGRHVKPRKVAPRRKKGERNPARIAQERADRVFAAYKAYNASRAAKGKIEVTWENFRYTSAYERAFKG